MDYLSPLQLHPDMTNIHRTITAMLLCMTAFAQAQSTYIYCGSLISMSEGAKALGASTIIVQGDTVARVADGYVRLPAGADLIDLRAYVVLPGLIDCHVHLEWEQSRTSYQDKYTLNDAEVAFRSAVYAERTLKAGFTTVRDLGGRGVNISLRNAVNAGLTPGPRIITSGRSLSVTGGHGDPTNGARQDLFDAPLPDDGVADGPDECRKAVREQVQRGADCIKVCATGGVLSLARDGRLPHYAEDELQAIVRTARDLGVDVAAHAHGDEGARRAAEAGVVSIEHGTFMSEATMDLLIRKGVWYVPTLTAGWAVSDSAAYARGFFPDMVRVKAIGIGEKIEQTLGRAYRRGVNIAFGTDAGVFPHGLNALEFVFMARAGMSHEDILQSATTNAARLLRMEDKIGAIAPGKYADLIAVKSNPLDDIQTLRHPVFVMKGGKVYRKPD
ncbi:MAG: amidohydrolase family protein [Saprospiraceae bacterium]